MSALEESLGTSFAADVEHDIHSHEDGEARFRVSDQASAGWAMRQVRRAEKEIAAITADEERLTREIKANADMLRQQEEQTVAFFSGHLTTWHRELLAADPGAKTVKLLTGGELKARKLPDAWEFDAATFLAWATAEERPEFVRIKVEPNIAEAKKALVPDLEKGVASIDGEVVPGVAVTPGEVRFSVQSTTKGGDDGN